MVKHCLPRMPRHAPPSLLSLLVIVVALAASAASAAPLAHREVLPNGMILLVAERPAIPIVITRVYVRDAGAVSDPAGREGLAHLTGGLLTRGAGRRTGPEIDSAIEFVGGSLEAGAGRDGVGVSLAVLKKDLDLGLDLLRDVVLAPTFPDAELQRKVKETQAAIKRSEESPDTVAARALARLLFAQHPYGRPAEGTVESVGKLTRDEVVKFHREMFRPDQAIVAVVGAITVDEARAAILRRFGSWPKPATAPPRVATAEPGGAPTETLVKKDLTQATIMLGRQAIRQTDPDYFPLSVAAYVLGGGSASRLYTRAREENGLVYSIYSYVSPGKYGASLVVNAQTRTAEVPRVTAIAREELARLVREPVSDRELTLAKSYLIGSFPLRLDTSGKVADFLVAIEQQELGLDYPDRYKARIGAVTAADVQRVAATFLAPDTFNRVVVGDVK
jgi:zinc protease